MDPVEGSPVTIVGAGLAGTLLACYLGLFVVLDIIFTKVARRIAG